MTAKRSRTLSHIDEPDLSVGVVAPHGWNELAESSPTDRVVELVMQMHGRADEWVDRAVRRIRETVGRYEHEDVVERDDLWWSVYRNLEVVLLALGEHRPLSDEELGIRRELGRRRAQQGMPLEDVLRAFRIGYTVLWEGLSELADENGQPYAEALLDRAAHVWMTFDQVTSAVAASYRSSLDNQRLNRRRRALALLAGLQRYPEDAQTTEEIAASLDLNPHGSFVLAVLSTADRCPPPERDLLVIEQPDRFVVVATLSNEPAVAEASFAGRLRRREYTHVGVGILREGLAGAQQSLTDAEWAHRLARAIDAPAVLYRESWLACMALRHHEQLDLLVAPAVQALEGDEELFQTLEAFLEADGNLTGAGKALYVHPNTVGYRLRQFAARTGVDPRTAQGMALVQVALIHSRLSRNATLAAT